MISHDDLHESSSERWRAAIVQTASVIREVIAGLDRSGLQIALVVDDRGVLQGTITDGDIRRGLLKGVTIDGSVDQIMRRNPLVVPSGVDRTAVLRLMRANAYAAIPVVDEARRVVGLHLLKELLEPVDRANLTIIMAGGKGTRLRPYTDDCPKPLLPVGGKPMLEHILDRARGEGLRRFAIALHYRGDMIEDYCGDGRRWGVQISYLREERPLGTAGALSLIDPLPDTPILVTNGDVLADVRYGEVLDFHVRHHAAATMVVRLHEWQHPYGVVKTRGVEIVGFEEKPIARSYINAGIYVLEPAALATHLNREPCSMPELFERLQATGARTIVYPMHESWADLGTPEDFHEANSTVRRD